MYEFDLTEKITISLELDFNYPPKNTTIFMYKRFLALICIVYLFSIREIIDDVKIKNYYYH
jgi:hypothetical protein